MKRFAFLLVLAAFVAYAGVSARRSPPHARAEELGWTTGPCRLALDHVSPLHDSDGKPTGKFITLVETSYYANCPAQSTVQPGWYRTILRQ
jgi:hypothetical protein